MTYPNPRQDLTTEAVAACARSLRLIASVPTPDQLVAFAREIRHRAPGLAAAALRSAAIARVSRPDHDELIAEAEGLERDHRPALAVTIDPVFLDGLLLEHDRYVAHLTRRVFSGHLPGEALTAATEGTEAGHLEAIDEAMLAVRAYLAGPFPDQAWREPARLAYRPGDSRVPFLRPKVEVRINEEVIFNRTWKEAMSYGPGPVEALLALIAPYLDVGESLPGSGAGAQVAIRGAGALLEDPDLGSPGGGLPESIGSAAGVLRVERREQEEAALWRLRDRGFNC